jgi:hypothetical protein
MQKIGQMKKIIAITLGFSLLLYACNGGKTTTTEAIKPTKLVSRENMIKLLMEVHLAEAGVSSMSIDHFRATALYRKYQAEILKKYALDTATYRQNYEYYMQSPLEMEYILTFIEDSLVRWQTTEKLKDRTTNQPQYSEMFPKSNATAKDSSKLIN